MEGLQKGLFYRKEGRFRVGRPHGRKGWTKLLLRADGTSVYMTQDIGTAKLRFRDFPIDKMIYVVGNEQNYHFKCSPSCWTNWASSGEKPRALLLRHGGTAQRENEEPRRYGGGRR